MPKVVVIGRRADILPFKALGSELVEIEDETKVAPVLSEIKRSPEPVMVMMTEDLAGKCSEAITDFRENAMNMLLPIPTLSVTPGARMEEVRSLVARALGVDLLGQKYSQPDGQT
ncbi:hypothetical protein LLG96_05550 [bacterium]|nr:hypothetical protein [bacterium]